MVQGNGDRSFNGSWVQGADIVITATPPYGQNATIRWDGNNTYVLLPNGKVDFVGKQLKAVKTPGKVDEQTFYFNVIMNSPGGKGYEFAGISSDQNMIVMKRRIIHQAGSK